ncbi:hypothetical protein J7643_10465 [bacterium]|nr:hypothetical protein [bacterium]
MVETRDLAVIRLALVRELETINHYQDLHDQASDPSVKTLMLHLMEEEKEHVAELTAMLRALDAVQDQYFREGHGAALGTGDVAALAHKPSPQAVPTPVATPAPLPVRTGLTVGSLIGQPLV